MFPKQLLQYLFLLLFSFASISTLWAQTKTNTQNRLILKISVPHIFVNSLNLEIEKGFKSTRHSLLISPRIYAGKTRTIDGYTGRDEEEQEPGKVFGYGAEAIHRIYLNRPLETTDQRLIYVAYGANFHHFNLDYSRLGWIEELNEKGYYNYVYKQLPYKDKVARWGTVVQLGWQEPFIKHRVLLDFFVGTTYRESTLTSDLPGERYAENSLDFGYSGFSLVSGLKLGYVIR